MLDFKNLITFKMQHKSPIKKLLFFKTEAFDFYANKVGKTICFARCTTR